MDQSPTLERFELNCDFAKLGKRRHTFYKMVDHLEKASDGLIIETGTAWDEHNWEGQGQSTLIWDWACKELNKHSVVSIDLQSAAKVLMSKKTEKVEYITADSVTTLNEMSDSVINKCRLLYLDSFDWSEEANLDSAFHHIAELACVWSRLPKGCLIVVDDRHANMAGKHFLVEAFMEKLGVKPYFSSYQIGWLKP